MAEDLDTLAGAYVKDPYERENLLTAAAMTERCARYARVREDYLELGVGHGVALDGLARAFGEVVVLEGSGELVRRHQGRHANVRLVQTLFEAWRSDRRWNNIGMGFILEHVEAPTALLRQYRERLAPGGSLFVGVPNARSLHRLLGQRMGLLPDLSLMSDADRALGHRRFLTYHQWLDLFADAGLRVVRAEGLYLKPFTTRQLEQLGLPPVAYAALADLAAEAPTLSNSCFFQLEMA